jgi:DNA processing protein
VSPTSDQASPLACDRCLRRAHLLGILAPFIEKVATGRPGERSPQLLALDDRELVRAVGGRKAEKLYAEAMDADPAALRDRIREADCWAICTHDRRYPPQLRDLGDAPPALVGRGEPSGLARMRGEVTVTVVGARRATSYGREIARSLAAELARAGFAVVSGLAWGVDGAAHEGALEGGFTAAVLGCGADVAYPSHHRRLYDRIRESGLILSELPPGTGAWRWAFPARNRIMAALGAMTIVVEAAGRSGSLITAELASDLGRDVGAVPGPAGARMSAGTNQLLADGARIVRDAQDVIDALIGPGAARPATTGPPLDAGLAEVLDRVEGGDRDSDSIALALSCGGGEATASLARLERLGYVQRSFAGTYSRTALPRPQREAVGEEADHLA